MSGLLQMLGIALLAASGTGLGVWKLHMLEKRLLLYQELERFLALTRESIENRGLPLDELMAHVRARYPFRLFPGQSTEDPRRLRLPAWCPEQEQALFSSCFAQLGSQGMKGSCRDLQYYESCSRELARDTREKLKTARQLYCPLGFCAGMVLALLIL